MSVGFASVDTLWVMAEVSRFSVHLYSPSKNGSVVGHGKYYPGNHGSF